jgi:small conductance mechanosensitive channel
MKLLAAIVIFYVGRWVARIVQNTLERILRKRAVDDVLVDFLGTIAFALVLVITVVAALDTLGIPATSLVAVVGAAGLAVGLALKDSLSNFAAGVMLVIFRPFTKGDFVDAGGVAGKVDEVFLVSTRLLTPDNKLITIPNGVVWNNTITNFSAMDTRRVDMVVGVGYDDDLKVAAEVLNRILAEHELVLEDPAPVVTISELGASSVDFAVRPWVKADDYWGVRADVLEKAKVQLEAAGCSIPYPQTDVHLHKVDAAGGEG